MYSIPQKSKCVPCKAGCQPWIVWDSGQVSASQAAAWCGCPSGGRRAKFGSTGLQQECRAGSCRKDTSAQGCSRDGNAGQGPAGRSPAVGGQRSVLCSVPSCGGHEERGGVSS